MVDSLLTRLNALGVQLSLNGEQLTVKAPRGALTKEVQLQIKQLKTEIIQRLKAHSAETNPQATGHALQPDQAARFEDFELTDIQQAYWIGRTDLAEHGSVMCHYYQEFESTGLDYERLVSALQKVIAKHDMLRAVVDSNGRQRIIEQPPLYRPGYSDMRGQQQVAITQEVETVRDKMAYEVFDASQWPLFNIHAVQMDEQKLRLHLSFDLIMIDAESLSKLIWEWKHFYDEEHADASPLSFSFRDYLIAENNHKQTQSYQSSLDYWQQRLDDLPAAPSLPKPNAADAEPDRNLRVRNRKHLAHEFWTPLKAQAKEHGITPSGLLCAIFGETLAAWSREPHFCMNLTFCDRRPVHPDVEDQLGDFTSNILLESDMRGISMLQRAKGIQQQLRRDLDHAQVSGVEVLRRMNTKRRSLMTMPVVFTSLLGHKKGSPNVLFSSNWLGEQVYGISQTPQVSLDFQAYEDDDGLLLQWDAIKSDYPDGTLASMFQAYHGALEKLSQKPSLWDAVQLVTLSNEQAAIRKAANDTTANLPQGLLHGPFERMAQQQPEATALITDERTLDYATLDKESLTLANTLVENGLKASQHVAVVMNKGWEQVVAVLAILRAGGAYLPIDASLPKARLNYLLENGEVAIGLTQANLQTNLQTEQAWPDTIPLLPVTPLAADAPQPSAISANRVANTDLAYTIFTSGSTGQPKGVMIDHRGALNTVIDVNRRFGIGKDDRVLGLSALNFDLSVYDIFGIFAAGGALVLPPAKAGRDPGDWTQRIKRHGVTVWNTVPQLMRMLVEYHEGDAPDFTSLKTVMMSGDWIPPSLPSRIRHIAPDTHIFSLGGATEASIWSIFHPIDGIHLDPASGSQFEKGRDSLPSIPYGKAMTNQTFYVLDNHLNPRPDWVEGELFIGGKGLAMGYWRNEKETQYRFVIHPTTGERLYRTGDLGRTLPDGNIEILGRIDFQVKIQGHRIELGEIEQVLKTHPSVEDVVVNACEDNNGQKRLVAYIASEKQVDDAGFSIVLTAHAASELPGYMVPSRFMVLPELPLSSNGKLDRKRLPKPDWNDGAKKSGAQTQATTIQAKALLSAVQTVLDNKSVTLDTNIFDIGGNSVQMVQINRRLRDEIGLELSVAEMFDHPTLASYAGYLEHLMGVSPAAETETQSAPALRQTNKNTEDNRIAVTGMALRFPGASTTDAFWQNLSNGVESITRFSEEELIAAGVPAEKLKDPTYVPVAGCLEDLEYFDADLFDIGEREAEIMDPQQRFFLSVSREALEEAGYIKESLNDKIGVFAGVSTSTYLLNNLHHLLDVSGADLNLAKLVANDKDYLATLVAHKFDLRGPAITVQTACSTSLVAIHQACQALLSFECDAALAGGVTVRVPHRVGYANQGGSMLSADGHCHAFDETANGTIPGSGAGAVVLKRLQDALDDGDPIHGVILGSAVNNDGAGKIGFTAPSISGQLDCITNAHLSAGISAKELGYIEAHGTGTKLGDPIEITALNKALGRSEDAYCAIGSVKTNFGHLESAAGVAGFIKTVLSLKHGKLLPSLGFHSANPEISFKDSPVYVNNQLKDWPTAHKVRRAGVSSFGFGGTNCHVVLEQSPESQPTPQAQANDIVHFLPLSARQDETLSELRSRYIRFLDGSDDASLADICFSASTERQHHQHRAALVGKTKDEMLAGLRAWARGESHNAFVGLAEAPGKPAPRAFVFGGQINATPGMASTLLEQEVFFRDRVAHCEHLLKASMDTPVSDFLKADPDDADAIEKLQQPQYAIPTLFVLEYALAELWKGWGVRPDYVLGDGFGDITAATVSGALSLKEAVQLVVAFAQNNTDISTGIAASISPKTPVIPWISSLDGKVRSPEHELAPVTPEHWQTLSGQSADLCASLQTLKETDCKECILISPQSDATEQNDGLFWIASLDSKQDQNASQQMRYALGQVYLRGAKPDWRGLFASKTGLKRVAVPVMPIKGKKYWIDAKQLQQETPQPASIRQAESQNGLLGTAIDSAMLAGQFEAIINTAKYPFLVDHGISAGAIFPATGYIDLALSAMNACLDSPTPVTLSQIEILQPLMLDTSDKLVQTSVHKTDNQYTVCIFSKDKNATGKRNWIQHFNANADIINTDIINTKLAASDVPEMPASTSAMSPDDFYAQTRQRGMLYGPEFRLISQLSFADKISRTKVETSVWRGGVIDPALLDASCQAAGVFFLDQPETDNFLPVAIDAVTIAGSGLETSQIDKGGINKGGKVQLAVTASLKDLNQTGAVIDIHLQTPSGDPVGVIKGMRFRRVKQSAAKVVSLNQSNAEVTASNSLYHTHWLQKDLGDVQTVTGRWLLIASHPAHLDGLSSAMVNAQLDVQFASYGDAFSQQQNSFVFNPEQPAQLQTLLEKAGDLTGIVHLWTGNPTLENTLDRPSHDMAASLHLAQAIIAAESETQLNIVTCNAHRIGPESQICDPSQSLIWGFAAALAQEHLDLYQRIIDIEDASGTADIKFLLDELAGPKDEPKVAWRSGWRFVQRLKRRPTPAKAPYRLHPSSSGMLDRMETKGLGLAPLKSSELLVRVHATGLNFRDVINALGMFPGNPGPLGGECAGIVEQVGSELDPAWIGKRVICCAEGAFSSHIISPENLVAEIPEVFSFEQAATIPITFSTSHYALNHVAKLAPGERVLIHAGAGGVGQAAIQIAKACKAEIYATAGSEQKREFLRQQGIEHVMDSRSLTFAEEIQALTQRQGIDVVLNALSDDFIPHSLDLLREGGRFLEIGKLGIWSPEKVAQAYPHVQYDIISLDGMIRDNPGSVKALLEEVMQHLGQQTWQLPQLVTFDFDQASDAFRYMQQAKHIGKVALRHRISQPFDCDSHGTYLITGGLGALGLETANYLAERGARQIALVSRRTPEPEHAQIARLQAAGVNVQCYQADIAQKADVDKVLTAIRSQGSPLKGVIHAAGIIEDAAVKTQEWASFQRVLAPKMLGGQWLSELTEQDPLDFFVLYSSASGELGAAGQGAYAAANALLDALAQSRSMQGLPGLSLAWGPWPAGMTSNLAKADIERMNASGLSIPRCEQYFDLMQQCLTDGDSHAIAMLVDWSRFMQRAGQTPPNRLEAFSGEDQKASVETWDKALANLPPAQQKGALLERILEQAARALSMGEGELPPADASLLQQGLDSLMAVELRNALAAAVGKRLSATILFDYPSPQQLADYFAKDIFGWETAKSEADSKAKPARKPISGASARAKRGATRKAPQRNAARNAKSLVKSTSTKESELTDKSHSAKRDDTNSADEARATILAELEKWSQRNA